MRAAAFIAPPGNVGNRGTAFVDKRKVDAPRSRPDPNDLRPDLYGVSGLAAVSSASVRHHGNGFDHRPLKTVSFPEIMSATAMMQSRQDWCGDDHSDLRQMN
jgi:hypothetical protein